MAATTSTSNTIPQEWLCPITYQIMTDPVIAPDGRTYERANIEEWLRIHGTSPFTRERVNVDQLIPNIAIRDIIQSGIGGGVHVETNPIMIPTHKVDPSKTIYCLIDRSGSMGIFIDTPGYESDGFNRLDLVKHSVRTIIHSLTPDYSLGIVSFDIRAKMEMEPVLMNGMGKAQAVHSMENIECGSTTNIWDGIRMIMNRHTSGDTPTILLFTDGESNVDPPRGIVPTLEREISRTGISPTIHTLGFGYDINSSILHDIGSKTGGLFGFIPDCTMIGSVFVNILAHVMSGGRGSESVQWPDLVEYLRRVSSSDYVYDNQDQQKHEIGVLLDKLILAHKSDERLKNVCDDIHNESEDKGQIEKAVSKSEWFKKWGQHYLRSLHLAHKNGVCINFKDASLQDYKTPEFTECQERIEDTFINLPSPIPSNTRIRSAITNGQQIATPMSVYYNASSGCFTGDTLVRVCNNYSYKLADDEPHKYRTIRDLRVGDWVVSANNESAQIRYIIKFVNHTSEVVRLSEALTISAYHPVRRYRGVAYGTHIKWEFPRDIAGGYQETHDLYNLVLERGGTIYTPTHECVVFGHNIHTDEVVSHNYFGTNAIVNDIADEDEKQGREGVIVVDRLQEIRDPIDGKVVKYIFNQ